LLPHTASGAASVQNRPRFPSIDNRELDSRRGFVTDAKTSLSQYDEHIKRLQHRVAVGPANQRKALLASSAAGSSRFQSSAGNDEASRGNDAFVRQSQMTQHRQTEEEDKVLIDMSHALERLQGIGQTINQQLVEQDVYAPHAQCRQTQGETGGEQLVW